MSLCPLLVSNSVFYLPPPGVFLVKQRTVSGQVSGQSQWLVCACLHVCICVVCESVCGGGDMLCSNFSKIKILDLGREASKKRYRMFKGEVECSTSKGSFLTPGSRQPNSFRKSMKLTRFASHLLPSLCNQ